MRIRLFTFLISLVLVSTGTADSPPESSVQVDSHVAESVFEEPYMLDHTILENFTLGASNGRLMIDKLRAMNLPQNVANKDALKMRYKDSAGSLLASFTGMPLPPNRKASWVMNYFRADDDASSDFKFDKAGDYSLEFVVNGKTFDDFRFSIAKHKDKDGSERIVANGPWEDLAYLEVMAARRPQPLKFVFYMRDFLEGTGERASSWGKYKVTITKDGKEIAVNNPDRTRTIAPLKHWTQTGLTFEKTGSNGYMLFEEDLKTDGDYLIIFEHEGSIYGNYPFSVIGGKLKGATEHDGQRLGSDGSIHWMPRRK